MFITTLYFSINISRFNIKLDPQEKTKSKSDIIRYMYDIDKYLRHIQNAKYTKYITRKETKYE